MQGRSKNDVLLTELIIVVLVFSLVAVTVVQMFVAAHQKSALSGRTELALIVAQDWAERLSGEQDPAAVLLAAGFAREGGDAYILERPEDGLIVKASMRPEAQSEAGRLLSADLSVWESGAGAEAARDPLVSLPVSSYIPREEVRP